MIYTCRICGEDLEIADGMNFITCPRCHTAQALPVLETDRQRMLYNLANRFRRNNEYDKAIAIYEQIISEKPDDAEAHWLLLLCRLGVVYTENPVSHQWAPSLNGTQSLSIYLDEDYKAVLQCADEDQKALYEQEAALIHQAQEQTSEQHTASLLKHISALLETRDWDNAAKYCDMVLCTEPTSARAYLGKLMADLKICRPDDLASVTVDLENNTNYQKAMLFGDPNLKKLLKHYSKESVYARALKKKQAAKTALEYKDAKTLFESLGSYSDAQRQVYECEQGYEQIREYQKAVNAMMNIWKK